MTGSNEKKETKRLARGKPLGITDQDWIDRTTFHYGDIVMAKIGKSSNSKPWIARIEFVNAELCPSRQQKHFPWEGTDTQKYDHDFKWPIFFYGTHEITWLREEDQLTKVKTAEDAPPFDPKFQYSEIPHERALFEFYTNPFIMQECWGELEKQNYQTKQLNDWLVGLNEIIPKYWLSHIRKVKNEVVNVIEEDKEIDAIQKEYKSAAFKIKNMQVGDMIGASYPRNKFDYFYYEGLIKEVKEGSIFVQFFRYCKGTNEYVEKKKDTDYIEEARQGYIYFHLKKEKIDNGTPTAKGCEVFKIDDPNIQVTMRQQQLNWNLRIAKINEDDDAIKKAQSELNQYESAKVVPDYVSNTRKRNRNDAKF